VYVDPTGGSIFAAAPGDRTGARRFLPQPTDGAGSSFDGARITPIPSVVVTSWRLD
jgi:hypothetical protein